jgi:hypothetical protein
MTYTISIENGVTAGDRRLIEEGLTRHALPTTLVPGFQPIATGSTVLRPTWRTPWATRYPA